MKRIARSVPLVTTSGDGHWVVRLLVVRRRMPPDRLGHIGNRSIFFGLAEMDAARSRRATWVKKPP